MLAHLGDALQPHCQRSRLNVAVCYARLNRDGRVQVASAGSIAPIVRRADGAVEWIDARGLPLGIELERAPILERDTRLSAGDMLVLISDGIVEAKNQAGEMFGFERFEQAIADSSPRQGAAAVHTHVSRTLNAFITPVEPEDDVTVVVLVKTA